MALYQPPEEILEIVTDFKLKDKFELKDGDIIEVEINAGQIIQI